MPIHKMSLEGDVFVTRAVGYMDNLDGKMWANALHNHADTHMFPIAAIIDMVEVNRLCPTVTKVINETIKASSIRGIGIVISDMMVSQNARMIDKLSEIPGVRIFATHADAERFAISRLNAPAAFGRGGVTVNAFSFAAAF
jgi:hypothetical protein